MKLCRIITGEKGISTVLVVTTIAFVFLMLSASLMLVESERLFSFREEGVTKALHLAEAGVYDYLWHLNKYPLYYENQIHPAQGQDAQGNDKWVTLGEGEYHLEITATAGEVPLITVMATGRVKSLTGGYLTRSVKAKIRKKSFVNYLYLTNYEIVEGTSQPIWWITGEVCDGPLHTNDSLHTDGTPRFKGKVTITGSLINRNGFPIFEQGYQTGVSPIEFPVTNQRLKDYALVEGYYYYGETKITMNSGGTLTIVNNDTTGKTKGPTGTVFLPSNGVIYVDGMASSKGSPTNGDVYVSGTLSGRLTVAVKNVVYITGDIKYASADQDMLGLVADNYIYVNHFEKDQYGRYTVDVAPYDIEINAAIFALNHSFGFERYSKAPVKGTLTVKGSIVQNYRGPVGTFRSGGSRVSGYAKDYHFDSRMEYQTPPHFVEPVNAGFEILTWGEIR